MLKAAKKLKAEFCKASAGQSLSEYGIAVALIAVVCISGVITLHDDILSAFNSLVSPKDSSFEPLTAQAPSGGQVVAVTTPTSQTGTGSAASGQDATPNDLSSPEYLDLGQYPTNIEDQIDVSGANGTTTQLLAVLDSTIAQALANGQITQEQSNALLAMSQQGHKIADIEATLEDIIAKGDVKKAVTYNGKKYNSAIDLALSIGTNSDGSLRDDAASFEILYKQAASQGALKDPTVNTVISTLMNQILNVANGMQDATSAVHNGLKTPSNYRQTIIDQLDERDEALGINTQKTLLEQGVAVVTHNNATAICLSGGDGETCKTGAKN